MVVHAFMKLRRFSCPGRLLFHFRDLFPILKWTTTCLSSFTGDEIEPPDGESNEAYRILFDITFFFFVIIILLAIIQGKAEFKVMKTFITIIIIGNPLTVKVSVVPQVNLQPVFFPILPCSPLPSGICQMPGLSIHSLRLSSYPFLCPPSSNCGNVVVTRHSQAPFMHLSLP